MLQTLGLQVGTEDILPAVSGVGGPLWVLPTLIAVEASQIANIVLRLLEVHATLLLYCICITIGNYAGPCSSLAGRIPEILP